MASASELSERLARQAEAVCRLYLSNGQKSGNYWLVGNLDNEPGRSLYVRLRGPHSGPGAAGKWRDAATGEHGDLLDLIARVNTLRSFPEIAREARRLLNSPQSSGNSNTSVVPRNSSAAAGRLFAASVPLNGTIAERYLKTRGILDVRGCSALRFHSRCYYRDGDATTTYPALIAAVSNDLGDLTGVHRTWLARDGNGKAPVTSPRRAMGNLLGFGVRFGWPTGNSASVMVAGEGLETVLSLRMALPTLPIVAALSAAHLGALVLPPGLQRLYVAADADASGRSGALRLSRRARDQGIEVLNLMPRLGDFNDDLRRLGLEALRQNLTAQLGPEDCRDLIGG
ncbi:toprim domain-containing protein [Devosia sp.]|jgi:hypothetical protein|uniref:DUF7146 domain-containing protein n=1 Tax=Devosia sp. TaxID=1871048 RepID=UPI0037BECE7B